MLASRDTDWASQQSRSLSSDTEWRVRSAITAHDATRRISSKSRAPTPMLSEYLVGGRFLSSSDVEGLMLYLQALNHVGEGWTGRTTRHSHPG